MQPQQLREHLVPSLFNACVRAGAAIMGVYRRPEQYQISLREDQSPITVANRQAHRIIFDYLGPTRIPVLSDEGRSLHFDERRAWELFWLMDPLDGTQEFIRGNNEFTVNIALMEQNRPIAGAIYAPYLGKMYLAWQGMGAYLKEHVWPDAEALYSYSRIREGLRRLPLFTAANEPRRVAVSRSHQSPETAELVESLGPDWEVAIQGSSYKFCLLAEGSVDLYIRTTATQEWDTAAGELILSEAGGWTRALPEGGALSDAVEPLRYNEPSLANPWFVAASPFYKP